VATRTSMASAHRDQASPPGHHRGGHAGRAEGLKALPPRMKHRLLV
jgi:hypothetical protein